MTGNIYRVEGMHCASCSLIIEKKLLKIDGVHKADVNFATEKAVIEFDQKEVDLKRMNDTIAPLGYTLADDSVTNIDTHMAGRGANSKEAQLIEYKEKTAFVLPIALLVFVLMLWDIGARTIDSVPNLPMPMELFNIISLVLSSIVLFWVGKPFIEGVYRFFRFRVANMDTLIGIGTLVAYIYSATITLLPQVRVLLSLPEYTYFDVVIVVIGFVTFGKYLETRSKQKTGEAIEKLIGLQAKTAIVLRDNKEIEVPISEVSIGDIVIVKPGGKIPVDGRILEGTTSIDEAMISGESIPVDKKIGDFVIGSTINKQGSIRYEATKVGEETMLAQIIHMVERAQGSRAPIQALADRISGVFVPIVLLIAFAALLLWLTVGFAYLGSSLAISYGILSFVGVLVIACPCALGLATPTAVIVGVGKGASHGVLIKDAESLEMLSKVDTVVLDKTGTITNGTPEVTDVSSVSKDVSEEELLHLAASVEQYSEHPLATALVRRAKALGKELAVANEFIAHEGVGVEALVGSSRIQIKKPSKDHDIQQVKDFEAGGKTVAIVSRDGAEIGYIAFADTIKAGAKEAVGKLRRIGIKVIMLTGDNERAAHTIASEAGIDTVIAGVMPQEKAGKIEALQKDGNIVAMAGDGINDAPALAQANVGIAMSTGTDVAIESAGVTLLRGDIIKLADAVYLGRATMRTVRQNLFFAFIYNVVGIPVAAGALFPAFGIVLSPIFAGLAMALSSVSVVGNALRLKTARI